MVRTFLRDAALPCTWLLLHTGVTANQVTLAALVIGVLGAFFLVLPESGAFLAAALLIQFWYYLDHVDGQIARYRKTDGLTGRFFDFLMHHIVHTSVVLGLGVHFSRVFSLGEAGLLTAFGVSFSMSLFNFMHDIKCKAFIERLLKSEVTRVVQAPRLGAGGTGRTEKSSLRRRVFSGLHKACEIHVMMNVFTFLALAEYFFFKEFDFRCLLFVFYAPVILVITVTKVTYFISKRKADEEFSAAFDAGTQTPDPAPSKP